LKTNNLVVGATPDFSFAEGSADFDPGSSLYLFSDGVFEITTKAGAQWGVADVVPFLLEPALPGTAEPERLHAAVQRNSRSPVLEDDFSMVVVTLA
jgi:sigma-B regulation protein RsbU (phosphoserine phosphatase)